MKSVIVAISCVAVLGTLVCPAGAVRTTVLGLLPGARGTAMGMTGVADTDVYLNPANATTVSGITVSTAYANWTGDVDLFGNTFVLGSKAGGVNVAGAVTHHRLDFKVRDPALGFTPFTGQSSFLTTAGAVGWNGEHGAIAAGVALAWSTSENFASDILVDAGTRVATPDVELIGLRLGAAAAWSTLHNGGGEPGSFDFTSNFVPFAEPEQFRYGVSLRAARGMTRDVAALTLNAEAVDIGQNGVVDGSAVGAEFSVLGLVHARAGYGDSVVGGHDAVTWGAGIGYGGTLIALRVDYARVDATDADFTANMFGLNIRLEF